MRPIILLFFTILLFSCHHKTDRTKDLKDQIDSLKNKLSDVYKPGFGEFMSNIQAHHSKLWFAGQNENWELADFEIHEIKEGLEDIEKYQSERIESHSIPMIYPALDSVTKAIQQRDIPQFERGYGLLTNTCTECHRKTNHEFIQITIPSQLNFSNQRFKMEL